MIIKPLQNEAVACPPFRGRVLYVARAPFVSGAERALVSMLRHLDRSRVEPMLALGCETKLVEIAASLNVPTVIVPVEKRTPTNLLRWWSSVRRLDKIVRRFRPDVLHANDVPSCAALSVVGAQRKLPRVVHVRWGIKAKDASWFAREGVEAVLCISDWVKRELGDTRDTNLEWARVTVLPDAVDWPADAGDARPPMRQLDRQPAIGFAGQLIPDKGLELVLRAMANLPAERRPRLLVAGKDTQTGGAYEKKLRGLADELGVATSVEWLGFLDDMGTLYPKVYAMVCPSLVEPLGLIPLEAARFAVPAIANRVGGFTQTILHARTGWLVEPIVEAWTQALLRLRDLRAIVRTGVAAYEHTRKLYGPGVYQAKLMRVYGELAGERADDCGGDGGVAVGDESASLRSAANRGER